MITLLKKMKPVKVKILAFFTLFILSGITAFSKERPEMADFLRSNGKIYIVVLVICSIFAGIIAYLVYLDRKIKKLEDKNK